MRAVVGLQSTGGQRTARPTRWRGLNLPNLRHGTFTGEHDEVAAQFTGKIHAGGAGDGHLRRGMNGEIRGELPDEPADADILHNHRVHAGGNHRAQIFFGVGEFVFEDERVERYITAHPAVVQKFHQFRQISLSEIVCPHPGIELFQPEIDRIGAVLDRGADAIPITGRREQFGQMGGCRLPGAGWFACDCAGHDNFNLAAKGDETKSLRAAAAFLHLAIRLNPPP